MPGSVLSGEEGAPYVCSAHWKRSNLGREDNDSHARHTYYAFNNMKTRDDKLDT